MSLLTVAEKTCRSCLFYNDREKHCVLWGTYLLQDIPCEYYRAEWGQIRWLRAFLGQFEEKNREGGK